MSALAPLNPISPPPSYALSPFYLCSSSNSLSSSTAQIYQHIHTDDSMTPGDRIPAGTDRCIDMVGYTQIFAGHLSKKGGISLSVARCSHEVLCAPYLRPPFNPFHSCPTWPPFIPSSKLRRPPPPPEVRTATLFDLPVLLQQLNLILVIVKSNLAAACNTRLVQSTHVLASLTSSRLFAPLWRLIDCYVAYLAGNCTTLWLKILMALAAPRGLKETLPPPL